MKEVIISVITGTLALAGVFISNWATAKQAESSMLTAQAVTNAKLEDLTREVREHNNFARRMPVVEEQIKVIHRRIDGMEDKR